MKTIKKIANIFTLIILFWSCDPSNPINPNEQEVITSLIGTAIADSDTVVFAFSDSDGVGGNLPTIDTIFLKSSKTYTLSIELIDETKNPNDTLTPNILAEAVDHQFFYTITNANFTNVYLDADANTNPIGLSVSWTTTTVSTGTIKITLKHQPGIKDGNITTGDTDIEVTFPIIIQ